MLQNFRKRISIIDLNLFYQYKKDQHRDNHYLILSSNVFIIISGQAELYVSQSGSRRAAGKLSVS